MISLNIVVIDFAEIQKVLHAKARNNGTHNVIITVALAQSFVFDVTLILINVS